MRKNLAYYMSIGTTGAAFVLTYVTMESLVFASGLGVALGAAAALGTNALYPSGGDLGDYNLDARRWMKKYNGLLKQVRKLTQQVTNVQSRATITEACDTFERVLKFTQEKEPGSVAEVASQLLVYLTSVNGVLDTYIVIQGRPLAAYAGVIKDSEAGFVHFKEFAEEREVQATRNQITAMKADLAVMQPLTIPTVPNVSGA